MEQALETIRNRIDQLGVRETTIAQEGNDEILVQLPGIQDPERAKELIGKTGVLEFKLVDDKQSVSDALRDGPPPGDEILYGPANRGGREPYLIETPVLMTGDTVTDARVRPGAQPRGSVRQRRPRSARRADFRRDHGRERRAANSRSCSTISFTPRR